MEAFVLVSRSLIAVGLTMLMAMLRLDAERFGTAEYYEATADGETPQVRRRLAWYGIGLFLALGILSIDPEPQADLFLGIGDKPAIVLTSQFVPARAILRMVWFPLSAT